MRFLSLLLISGAAFAQPTSMWLKGLPPGGIGSSCSPGVGYMSTAGQLITCQGSPAVWTVVSSTGGGITVKASGITVGLRNTINIIPGTGIIPIVTDTGSQINIQIPIDTAVTDTRLNAASGADLLVVPASGSGTAYIGCPSGVTPPLTSGMVVHLVPDVSSTGGASTLNYCGTSAVAFMEADGSTNLTASDLVAGRQRDVWYDGTRWRLKTGGACLDGSVGAVNLACLGMSPTASATVNTAVWNLGPGSSAVQGMSYYIPAGTYSVTCPLTTTVGYVTVFGDGPGSILSCANGSSADSVVYFSGGAGISGDGIHDLTLSGNSNIAYGLHLYNAHHSYADNVRVLNVATAGIYLSTVVLSRLSRASVDLNETYPAWVVTPVTGISVASSNSISIVDPIIEGVSGTGIAVTGSGGVEVAGGTSEGNGGYGWTTATSNNSVIRGTDLESNGTADILVISGNQTLIEAIPAGGLTHIAGGSGTKIVGSILPTITIDSGAVGTVLDNVSRTTLNNSSASTLICDSLGCSPKLAAPINGLKEEWSFTEGAGTTAYNSAVLGSPANGTFGGTANPTWTTAAHMGGYAVAFDGTNDRMVAASTGLTGNTNFSVCGWYFLNATQPAYAALWSTGDNTVSYVAWASGYGSQSGIQYIAGSIVGSGAYFPIPLGAWTHQCFILSGGTTVTMYLNGLLQGSPQTISSSTVDLSSFTLGKGAVSGRDLNGNMNDVRIYSRALTANEVWNLYAATR